MELDLTGGHSNRDAELMSIVTDTLPASLTTPRTRIATVTPAARPRLLTGPVVRLFAADFAAMISFYMLLSAVPLYAADRGIGTAGAGLSTGVLMFTAVAAELATPALAARLGYRRLLMGGLVLLGTPALVLPAAGSLLALMLVSVGRGIGFAIVVVTVGAIAATAIPAQRRGEGLGVLGASRSPRSSWVRRASPELRFSRDAAGGGLIPERVINIGTVSKSLAPTLRLGC
jgi:Major Facilitator Superfamily